MQQHRSASEHKADVPADEDLAHYAPESVVLFGMKNGTPITALCGFTKTPTTFAYDKPKCPTCMWVKETFHE